MKQLFRPCVQTLHFLGGASQGASTISRSFRASAESALTPPKVTASFYPGILDQRSTAETSIMMQVRDRSIAPCFPCAS
jgi:hypothetical protein